MKRCTIWVGLLALALLVSACTPASNPVITITGNTMGTTYSVKIVGATQEQLAGLDRTIDADLIKVNKWMSTYDPTSELSLLNQYQGDEFFPVSPQTLDVIEEAVRLGDFTDGVLDVTVGPLVNLWGFGPDARPIDVPTDEQLASMQARIGLDKLVLNDEGVKKLEQSLYIDLSTIAKGYGVDVVAERIESRGIQNYLVEIGGEMRLKGKKETGDWIVAVEKPVTNERAIQTLMSVGDNSVATSGDYRNYFERDGVRFSHLIDPTTGKPIQHNLVSVTVIHESAMTADGLSTGFAVMGKDRALALANQHDLKVLLITKEQDSFVEYKSDAFARDIIIYD